MTNTVAGHPHTTLVQNREGAERSIAREMTEEERAHGLPCVVRHPDASGQCERKAEIVVHGLLFCEAHDAEAKAGALEELYHDAEMFFERFRTRHVPRLNPVVELEEVTSRMNRSGWAASSDETLRRAYPADEAPEGVRDRITTWELDEGPGYAPVANRLLDCQHIVNKLMRLAHEASATWLVEVLEYERESIVAQAAVALRDRKSDAQ